jgi:hypothetical protein
MDRRIASPSLRAFLLFVSIALTVGCGGDQTADPQEAPAATGMQRTPAPPGAAVFIFSPADGATVSSPVPVKFGVSGIEIAPAGQHAPNTGHHHLLIDAALADAHQPIPADPQHVHYGKGQTEASIELEPGRHTLQLVLGDGNHVPHDPPVVSKVVTITVE